MNLSDSGRIVIVDDDYSEMEPLLQALGRISISYAHYDGSVRNLPSSPIGGIRFVFLDIVLEGMTGLDDKNKASALVGILKKIIAKDNGPYVIIFWTQHKEIIDLVLQNCKSADIEPVASVDLDKKNCLKNADPISKITRALHIELATIGAFRLYVEWENLVNQSSKKFIADLASIIPLDANWSNATESMFYCFYKSFVDKAEIKNKHNRFKCACHIMNRSYFDTLEKLTDSALTPPKKFSLTERGTILPELKAKLNSSLHLRQEPLQKVASGNVFIMKNKELHNILKKGIFREGKTPESTTLCGIVITPQCDLAQNKTLPGPGKGPILHRLLYGLLFDAPQDIKQFEIKSVRRGESVYYLGPIWHKRSSLLLLIDFATMSYLSESKIRSKALFALRTDTLFDLQSKAANHINRLGGLSIE
ncbi:MAG: hypothetical protein NT002_00265 [candidate division Zixibacteria bacterium]|nr:hypothetical protein [candidate division Zixibacteria bacterium]